MISAPARADWINLSGAENAPNIAEIYVNGDHVRLVLEIFVRDIPAFRRILPDDFFKEGALERPPLPERLRRFSNGDFQFITGNGKKLLARVKIIEPRMRIERPSPYVGTINPATGRTVPGPPEDKRVLYAELVYPFSGKPDRLTIVPPSIRVEPP